MKKSKSLLLIAGLVTGAASLSATMVIPPTFDQLVDQAQVIFQGTVTKISSQWIGEGAERHIVSYITFKVKDGLKGSPGESFTMRTFGGTVDEETMTIGDGPTFEVGDEDILFVENNGSQVVPLVGIMHGRFHVRKDGSGHEMVTTNEDQPLENVARLGHPETAVAANAQAMTTAAFKSAIQSRLQSGPSSHSVN
jgi:hypothetical protein